MRAFDRLDGAPIPPPGAHGGDAEVLAEALGLEPRQILDLSATLNPLAPDVGLLVQGVAEAARRYPEPSRATAALAEAIGVDKRRLLLTNGGAEAIALVAGELGQAEIVEPEFSLWRRHLTGARPVPGLPGGGRVRSNPNNPTGELASDDEIAMVWDEAFYPLSTGRWTRGDSERGAIVVGSLTKLFACPGLRLGYVIAPEPNVTERLAARQPMWSVNALALGVLPQLLESARLEAWASDLGELRRSLASIFQGYGLSVVAAAAPWILVRQGAWLRAALGRRGVLIRDCASFGLVDTVRIAVPGPSGLARLAETLDRAMEARP